MVEKPEVKKEKQEGRYVYCVVDKAVNFDTAGIEESKVYSIPYKNICAIVHACEAKPYKSDNNEEVKTWIISHQKVIDKASQGTTAIPLTFDMIIKGSDNKVFEWLKKEYENLKKKIEKIKGKQEFGIQIFWNTKVIASKLDIKVIKELKNEMTKTGKGKAYFYEQKIKNILRKELEKKADQYFKDFYSLIKKYSDEIKVEKLKEDNMLANFSCLVERNKVKELGIELDKINKLEGFSVRFTGPWSPYSFV